MANTKSAKKAARQAERRTLVNKNRRSRMRTYVRKVEEAIASGDKAAAAVALREAQPEIMRSASKGILHKNTASRKISRLSARIKAIDAALSAPDLYAREPAQAAALVKERAERAALLAAAEDEWLSLSAAYEEATAAE